MKLNQIEGKISFKTGVKTKFSEGSLTISHGWSNFAFRRLPAQYEEILSALKENDYDASGLVSAFLIKHPSLSKKDLFRFLDILWDHAFLQATIRSSKGYLTIIPMTKTNDPPESSNEKMPPLTRLTLSRFAYIHATRKIFILESPLSTYKVECDPGVMELLFSLFSHTDRTTEELKRVEDFTHNDTVLGIVRVLFFTGFLVDDALPEQDIARRWEFHDLLFHVRSRSGRHDYPVGRTFPFREIQAPLPNHKEMPKGEIIALDAFSAKPNDDAAGSFFDILNNRRSIREFGEHPLTKRQVSEFLFRTLRIEREIPIDGKKYIYETSVRPYPSGGGAYELECYLAVEHCDGLEKGVYYYSARDHWLVKLSAVESQRSRLIHDAKMALGSHATPPLLIVLTARFGRINWKYQTMGYSAVLKNVGVLFQSMYMVAKALNLAPCALGCGDSDTLSDILNLSILDESAVGEFVLGSLPQYTNDPTTNV